ncbi:MAG: hypothetical protein KY468_01805 [Armatimonadetes bacterium]|nr:hypothetical protein [Armatimonadota bacterium]
MSEKIHDMEATPDPETIPDPEATHDPKETAIAFAGVALVSEALDCPVVKMDVITEILPDGTPCTSGIYATAGVPLYDVEGAPSHERATLTQLNDAIRARVAARLGLAGDVAYWIYRGDPDPEKAIREESELYRKAREEVSRYMDRDNAEEYLRAESALLWEFLHRRWDLVDRVADHLLRHRSLTGERIRELIEERLEREKKPRIGRRRAGSRGSMRTSVRPEE